MTNAESAKVNSHTLVTVQDNHLSNATRDQFFSPKWKKNLSKTTSTKLYLAKKWETNISQQCIKNKRLSNYIYSIATLQFKVCLMPIKTGKFIKSNEIIESYVKSYERISFFFLYRQQRHFWNTVEYLWWDFLRKKLTAKSC